MTQGTNAVSDFSPGLHRLASLIEINEAARRALWDSARLARSTPARGELVVEGKLLREPRILLDGWAAKICEMPDGRRQILGLLLPGDLIGLRQHRNPIACATIIALTPVYSCPAPSHAGLEGSYGVSVALQEAYQTRQIMRLGRMSAFERLADLLLELHARLPMSVAANQFPLPMTQEMLADLLGITSVHVNRTLQAMRKSGLIELRHGTVRLLRLEHLVEMVDYKPAVVSADQRKASIPGWPLAVQAA